MIDLRFAATAAEERERTNERTNKRPVRSFSVVYMRGSTAAPGDNFGEELILRRRRRRARGRERERERDARGNLSRCRDFALLEVCNRVYDGGRRREIKNERGRPPSASARDRASVRTYVRPRGVRAPVFRPELQKLVVHRKRRTATNGDF